VNPASQKHRHGAKGAKNNSLYSMVEVRRNLAVVVLPYTVSVSALCLFSKRGSLLSPSGTAWHRA
jgi:hypothetical protein